MTRQKNDPSHYSCGIYEALADGKCKNKEGNGYREVFQDGTTAFREVAWRAVTPQKLTVVTAREQDDLRNKNEREGLMAELQHMRKKLDELKTAQAEQQSQAPSATTASQASAPSLGDTVNNCASQLAALEACKQLPHLAGMILCKSVAKSQFPCEGM